MKITIDNFITGKEEVLEVDDKEVLSGVDSKRRLLTFTAEKAIKVFKDLEYQDAQGEKQKINNVILLGVYGLFLDNSGALRLQVGRNRVNIAKITLTEVPNFSIAWKESG